MKINKSTVIILLAIPISLVTVNRFPFSRGERYFRQLQHWYLYAQQNDWAKADLLAVSLDPADIAVYKSQYHPDILRPQVGFLSRKADKSIEDYLELSRIYLLLGQKDLALQALQTAQELDPIRDDIGNLIIDLKR